MGGTDSHKWFALVIGRIATQTIYWKIMVSEETPRGVLATDTYVYLVVFNYGTKHTVLLRITFEVRLSG